MHQNKASEPTTPMSELKIIDGSTLQIFEMVLASFLVKDKLGRARFFQKTFLLADTSMKVVLGMLFLTFRNADI